MADNVMRIEIKDDGGSAGGRTSPTQSATSQQQEAAAAAAFAEFTARIKALNAALPPAPGTARFYHGSSTHSWGPGEKTYYAADPARAYQYSGGGRYVQYVDIPHSHPTLREVQEKTEWEMGERAKRDAIQSGYLSTGTFFGLTDDEIGRRLKDVPPAGSGSRQATPPSQDDLRQLWQDELGVDIGDDPKGDAEKVREVVSRLSRGGGRKGGGSPPQPATAKAAAPLATATADVQEVRDRLSRGVLSLDEAFERVAKIVGKFGDKLTDEMRDRGVIGKDKDAQDYFRGVVENTAERTDQLPVAKRQAIPIRKAKGIPIARGRSLEDDLRDREDENERKKNEWAREDDEEATAEAAREAKAEKRRAGERRQQMNDVGAGARTMATADSVGGKVAGAAQIAGSGALGEGAAALAAGPVGAAVAAAAMIYDTAAEAIQGIGNSARAGVQAVARDGLGSMEANVGVVTDKLKYAGLAWYAAGEAMKTAGAAADAFVARGKELGYVSGDISQAGAQADTRKLLMDLQEANRLGPDYAKLIDQQSQTEAQIREFLLPLKEDLLKFASEGMTLLQAALIILEGVWEDTRFLRGLIFGGLPNLAKLVADNTGILEEAKKLVEAANQERDARLRQQGVDGITAIRRMREKLDRMRLQPVAPNPVPPDPLRKIQGPQLERL